MREQGGIGNAGAEVELCGAGESRGQGYRVPDGQGSQRAVDRAGALGFTFNLGIETEFYLVRRENGSVVPANERDVLAKAAYDIVDLLDNLPFLDEIIELAQRLGFRADASPGPGDARLRGPRQ